LIKRMIKGHPTQNRMPRRALLFPACPAGRHRRRQPLPHERRSPRAWRWRSGRGGRTAAEAKSAAAVAVGDRCSSRRVGRDGRAPEAKEPAMKYPDPGRRPGQGAGAGQPGGRPVLPGVLRLQPGDRGQGGLPGRGAAAGHLHGDHHPGGRRPGECDRWAVCRDQGADRRVLPAGVCRPGRGPWLGGQGADGGVGLWRGRGSALHRLHPGHGVRYRSLRLGFAAAGSSADWLGSVDVPN